MSGWSQYAESASSHMKEVSWVTVPKNIKGQGVDRSKGQNVEGVRKIKAKNGTCQDLGAVGTK